jgi:hypothetical protein
MCRSNVIIYQNETKFEIYCNDKTESHYITEMFLKLAINTITWVWTNSLIMHAVTFRGIVNVEKLHCDFFLWLFFLLFLWLFNLCLCSVYHLCIVYNISFIGRDVRKSNFDFIEISCSPMKRQTIICIRDFW